MGVFLPAHERAEVLQVARQQMGCMAGNRGLENRAVFLGKRGGAWEMMVVFSKLDTLQRRV